jgi:phosphoribosyl 1,2-cyclic phosphodiesterase
MASLAFKFWGVRGSIPSAGGHTLGYGGNTPCLEIRAGDAQFIVDMGSGLRALGQSMGRGPHQGTVLLSHYHYDHVQGLPFFAPIFDPASRFAIFGPSFEGKKVRDLLAGQMVQPYFPVGLEVLRAQIEFGELRPDQDLAFGALLVKTASLYHPGGSLGFRFELGGKSICYCTDVEHDGGPGDARLVEFARGADWFLLDAMYTPEEYPAKRTFGHSTWEFATAAASRAGVKNLVLCHHDPARTDEAIDGIVASARARFAATRAAREGERVEV